MKEIDEEEAFFSIASVSHEEDVVKVCTQVAAELAKKTKAKKRSKEGKSLEGVSG